MKTFPQLNFPACKFKVRRCDNSDVCIWDIVRNRWLLLTPEEWVRQHIIHWLVKEVGVEKTSIVCEYPVNINGLAQRADIVLFDGIMPILIVECKAPEININKSVFEQVTRYNTVVDARGIIVSNGLTTLYFECIEGLYRELSPAEMLMRLK